MRNCFYLSALLVITLLASCSDDEKMPDEIMISYILGLQVVDEEGNNLLNPNNSDNILENDISMVFNGQKYPLQVISGIEYADITLTAPPSNSKWSSFIKWKGLCYITDEVNPYRLRVGLISSSFKTGGENLSIDFGDGTSFAFQLVQDGDTDKNVKILHNSIELTPSHTQKDMTFSPGSTIINYMIVKP